MAEGFLHEFEGWAIFLLCIAFLGAEVAGLVRIGSQGRFRFEYLGPAHGALAKGRIEFNAPVAITFAIAVLLATLFGTNLIDQRAQIEPEHPSFSSFPLTLGEWHGRQQPLNPEILNALELSDYWIADYSRADDRMPVNFYIAYYARQRVGSEAHSPSNCIPGGGWKVENEQVKIVTLGTGEMLSVTRLLIRRAAVTQLVYYWFDERGRNITDTYRAKWYLLKDALMLHRTDGALVRLVTTIGESENEMTAENRLGRFLETAYPALNSFIPDAPNGNIPRRN